MSQINCQFWCKPHNLGKPLIIWGVFNTKISVHPLKQHKKAHENKQKESNFENNEFYNLNDLVVWWCSGNTLAPRS